MTLRQKYLERFPGAADIAFGNAGQGTAIFPNGQTLQFEMDPEDYDLPVFMDPVDAPLAPPPYVPREQPVIEDTDENPNLPGDIVYMQSPKQIVGETIFLMAAGAGLLLWLAFRKR